MSTRWAEIQSRILRTYASFQRHDGDMLAASVAYYTALALFPLLLVLISGLGLVLEFTALGQNAKLQVLTAIAEYASPALKDDVERMLGQVQTQALVGGPLGMLVLLFSSIAMFVQFERAFNRIWAVTGISRPGVTGALRDLVLFRFKAFLMLLALAALIFVIFLAGLGLSTAKNYLVGYWPAMEWTWSMVQLAVSILLNSAVATAIYRLLPRVPVKWRHAYQGGLLAAIVWELGRVLLAEFLVRNQYSAYGVVGSLLAVMLWIYYANLVLFFGAEYVRVLGEDGSMKAEA